MWLSRTQMRAAKAFEGPYQYYNIFSALQYSLHIMLLTEDDGLKKGCRKLLKHMISCCGVTAVPGQSQRVSNQVYT